MQIANSRARSKAEEVNGYDYLCEEARVEKNRTRDGDRKKLKMQEGEILLLQALESRNGNAAYCTGKSRNASLTFFCCREAELLEAARCERASIPSLGRPISPHVPCDLEPHSLQAADNIKAIN